MKQNYLFLMLIFSALFSAQSVSASKLLQYCNSQNINSITHELIQLGFQTKTDNSEGYPIYQFAKKSSRGLESIEISKNSELFMFVYKTNAEVYEILKSKLLLPSFSYAYAYRNTKYYENGKMRIGLNDSYNIFSIFKPLKLTL